MARGGTATGSADQRCVRLLGVSFRLLVQHYLKADFGADAVRPKSANTIPIVEHYVRDYLIKRFGEAIADDIKPLDIQRWLKSLNKADGLAWTTISKIRGIMLRIYKIGIRHEHVSKILLSTLRRVQSPAIGQSLSLHPKHLRFSILTLSHALRVGAHLRGDSATLI
jgi:hypothetical protein